MSVQTELTRLATARNTIRNKMVNLGLAESGALIDDLATAVDGIVNNGAVDAEVQEGESYTVPAGYHNGSGVVKGVGGGGNYTLQAKSVTPTKSQQSVTSDSGYYGLSGVTVAAIPEAYQDVSSVTAAAGEVLANKVFVTKTGAVTAGTMVNNGAVSKTLDASTQSYTVPAGYHNGSGKVQIAAGTVTVTPKETSQTMTATAGTVYSGFTVNAIPNKYGDATNASTENSAAILSGTKAIMKTSAGAAKLVTGTMPNFGAMAKELTPVGWDPITGDSNQFELGSGYITSVSVTVKDEGFLKITPSMFGLAGSGGYYSGYDGSAIAHNGAINSTIDGLTTTSATIPAGYTTGGTVSLTNDIEEALAAI